MEFRSYKSGLLFAMLWVSLVLVDQWLIRHALFKGIVFTMVLFSVGPHIVMAIVRIVERHRFFR